ncbi:MAG: S41 family peptidase [Pseudobdellovibrio sp.]
MNQGYYSQPTISKSHIAFISDDDLWLVSREGGVAQRLTANKGLISSPCFSPDGRWIAFLSNEIGAESDVYIMPAEGGEATRLTWLGAARITGWKDNKNLYFISNVEGYPGRETHLFELNIETHDFKKLNLGAGSYYKQGSGFQVLARFSGDPARWKRYQGGTAGVIWTQTGKGRFQRILKNIKTNISKPEVVGKNIYFITDHEGVANVYCCDLSGQNIKRLTQHLEYYCRALRSCDDALVYQCGAEIYLYDLKTSSDKKVDISCSTAAAQAVVRYENWARFYDSAAVSPHATDLALVSRGHLFLAPPFSGAVKELDFDKDIRYSNPCYNFDGSFLLAAAANGESDESLVLFDLKKGTKKTLFQQNQWGKIWELKPAPQSNIFALINNKNEVYLVDLNKNTIKAVEKNEYNRPSELDWSPDGRYLAYTAGVDSRRNGIRVYDTHKSHLQFLLNPVCNDTSPSFDPEGKYLYFLSVREFAPNYNETHFDLGFPFATRPYVVSLQPDTVSPFAAPFENPKVPDQKPKEKENKKKKPEALKVEIDFNGIQNRVLAFNFELGGYTRITGVKGGVLYWKQKIEPSTIHPRYGAPVFPSLHIYKFDEAKENVFQANTKLFSLNESKTHVLLFSDSKLRLVETKSKPSDEKTVGKKDGYLDMGRFKLKIDPRQEWAQMYHEAWVLQKEHFWRKDMSKVDWKIIYERYKRLLPKVKTRLEFSDVMWEMQGELGTSHCYEMGGDYNRVGAGVSLGKLGGFFSFDAKNKSYTIDRIIAGDSWVTGSDSPLTAMGVNLNVGDQILAVDGFTFSKASDLYEQLENKVNLVVELTVKRKNKKETEKIGVKPNNNLKMALYREWVEHNKAYVHKASNGKLGYVHIPDMGPYGYAEFYKHFIAESDFEGLVVDVRFNGGGHVSQHLLKVLAQQVIGFDQSRYQGVFKYPMYAPGVLVALANEFSGSDGDIFPHSFKLMKLGKLIGKRTWGGIIGINGQYSLRDKTSVTQPEYSFWFKDNEWHVENHGVPPDIEVDITPEDYRDKKDPQLDRAIKEALSEIKKNPGLKFKPSYYPDLSLPKKLQKLNR